MHALLGCAAKALCLWQQWSSAHRNIPISPSQLTDGITVAMGAASSDTVHVPLHLTWGSRLLNPGLLGESLPAVPHPKQRDHSTAFSLVCKSKPQQTQIFADLISRISCCSWDIDHFNTVPYRGSCKVQLKDKTKCRYSAMAIYCCLVES